MNRPSTWIACLAAVAAAWLAGATAAAHPGAHDGIAEATRRLDAGAGASELLARAELHRIAGELDEAERDLGRALEQLSSPNPDLVVEMASLLVLAGPQHLDDALTIVLMALQRSRWTNLRAGGLLRGARGRDPDLGPQGGAPRTLALPEEAWMRIADMNWMDVEAYVARDDRAVLPLGSVEQHAYLSLATDALLAERVAVEAAEPLGVPVFPVMPYGVTPYFTAYPGAITLGLETFLGVVRDLLDGIASSGFRRIVVVNGHGGNAAAQTLCAEWVAGRPLCRVKFHNWWTAPRTGERARAIDPRASHASWMESFPWTRVAGAPAPAEAKPMVDWARVSLLDPRGTREALGDGSFGGPYRLPEDDMAALWAVAVEETRAVLEGPWS